MSLCTSKSPAAAAALICCDVVALHICRMCNVTEGLLDLKDLSDNNGVRCSWAATLQVMTSCPRQAVMAVIGQERSQLLRLSAFTCSACRAFSER